MFNGDNASFWSMLKEGVESSNTFTTAKSQGQKTTLVLGLHMDPNGFDTIVYFMIRQDVGLRIRSHFELDFSNTPPEFCLNSCAP